MGFLRHEGEITAPSGAPSGLHASNQNKLAGVERHHLQQNISIAFLPVDTSVKHHHVHKTQTGDSVPTRISEYGARAKKK